jgi:DNA-nicking Smr family endonuclease
MAHKKRKRRKNKVAAPASGSELSGIALLLVESPVETLDLHGMNSRQAETRLRFFFQRHTATSPGRVVHVITGKGLRSEGAPVLPGLVRDMLEGELGNSVSESATLHGGGGFAVRIAGSVRATSRRLR